MQIIPLTAVPSQLVNVLLAGQNCQIKVYQKSTGMFVDLYVDNALIIGGVIAENLNRIVRDAYLGFVGDLVFYDTQSTVQADGTLGGADPSYTGLGAQFQLLYVTAAELP